MEMKNRMVCLIACSLFAFGALPVTGLTQTMQMERLRLSLYVYQTLSYPNSLSTNAYGIDGNNVVGSYKDASGNVHGFLYNGRTYQTLDVPGAGNTYACGINGGNIVGFYEDTTVNRHEHGFFYNGSTYKTIDPPGSVRTQTNGISGNLVVGFYTTGEGYSYGCIYDISPNPYFPPPNFIKSFGFPGSYTTIAYGIYGNKIVGYYLDEGAQQLHGFLYDNTTDTYTPVDKADSSVTYPMGIYGNTIVGSYSNTGVFGEWYGFLRYLNPAVTGIQRYYPWR
jgi:hypothetical protein